MCLLEQEFAHIALLLQFKQETIIKFPHVGMVAALTCYKYCKAFQMHIKTAPDFVVC